MKVMIKNPIRIKSTILTCIACVLITFVSSFILLSEWYYKEGNLSPICFKAISIILIFMYIVCYLNLSINIFSKQQMLKRETITKIFLIMYFITQTFFSFSIFLSLLLIIIGVW
jgi:ABC-type polysaccharide/polyol phosphate export permease